MDTKEILETTIKEYQGVIDKAKYKLAKMVDSEATYSIGDRFIRRDGEKYLLAAGDKYNDAVLIALQNGLPQTDEQEVGNKRKITPEELDHLSNAGRFTRYWDSQKKQMV